MLPSTFRIFDLLSCFDSRAGPPADAVKVVRVKLEYEVVRRSPVNHEWYDFVHTLSGSHIGST